MLERAAGEISTRSRSRALSLKKWLALRSCENIWYRFHRPALRRFFDMHVICGDSLRLVSDHILDYGWRDSTFFIDEVAVCGT